MTDIPWSDRRLQELVKLFLYETLLTNDPEAEVTVSLRRRSQLKDLSEFVGVQPTYWLHLRISGRSVRLSEFFIDEFFSDIGYTCGMGRCCRFGDPPGNIHSRRYAGDKNSLLPGRRPPQAEGSISYCRCASRWRFQAPSTSNIESRI